MKCYHEMIQWVVDQVDHGKLRYYEWPAVLAIAEDRAKYPNKAGRVIVQIRGE